MTHTFFNQPMGAMRDVVRLLKPIRAIVESRIVKKPGAFQDPDLIFEGKTFGELKPSQRARLLNTDEPRYRRLEAHYEAEQR